MRHLDDSVEDSDFANCWLHVRACFGEAPVGVRVQVQTRTVLSCPPVASRKREPTVRMGSHFSTQIASV